MSNGNQKDTDNINNTDTNGEKDNLSNNKPNGHINGAGTELQHLKHLSGMYRNWFLDYASYVIMERAVPSVFDGLKPVQRRILHALKRLDDGRYNKVANVIGFTMQYHPHGDASIGDALVGLGQKELLIDTQGNWGNIYTGDRAAAPRYIEARLSKFALDVVFNPKTTDWKLSYDGRNKEPILLPVKFPLLLAQGVEGIAVGLASRILPHNFIELLDACIDHLQDKPFQLMPDFATGGMADCSRYNDGMQGGKVRVRAKISRVDKKTIAITELPYGKTTTSLIDSVINANEKGKIKIKKIDDNTSDKVEILIYLATGVSADQTIAGLYAFTDCEISISPNLCIIEHDRPRFISVTEALKTSVQHTVEMLTLELKIRKQELEDGWHKSSLEKIFIENRIYNHIEECETWESIIETIDRGLDPFKHLLRREVTYDDIVRLTEIKIKRISRYDAFKADEYVKSIEKELEEVEHHLANIIPYSIAYYQRIKEKYGPGRERKTELRGFDVIEATKVVVANEKLYVNRKEGFIGTSLKKDEFVGECSDIDDVIVFLKDGRYVVSKVAGKTFIGKNIVYVGIFKKNDDRTVYNAVYQDGRDGPSYIKRFAVVGVTRDREYNVTRGTDHSRILYFSANPNGEAEVVKITLKPRKFLRKLEFEADFSELAIKGRGSQGNVLSKYPVYRVGLKESGVSTLGGRDIWFDTDVTRLNDGEQGRYLGEFSGEDKIVAFTRSGSYRTHGFDLTTHFEPDVILVEKYDPEKIYTAGYFEGEQEFYYLKRFQVEPTEKLTPIIGEHPESSLSTLSSDPYPQVKLVFGGKRKKGVEEVVDAEAFIAVKGFKARGRRLSTTPIEEVFPMEPLEKEAPSQPETGTETPDSPDLEPGPGAPVAVGDEVEPSSSAESSTGEKDDAESESESPADTNGKQRSLFR